MLSSLIQMSILARKSTAGSWSLSESSTALSWDGLGRFSVANFLSLRMSIIPLDKYVGGWAGTLQESFPRLLFASSEKRFVNCWISSSIKQGRIKIFQLLQNTAFIRCNLSIVSATIDNTDTLVGQMLGEGLEDLTHLCARENTGGGGDTQAKTPKHLRP